MISTDFAPNEDRRDAMYALSVSAKPGQWHSGSALTQVAETLASYFPHHHASLFLTARAALYSYLKTLRFDPGSEIMVTGFTCKAVIIPILALKLTPVYVDIDTDTYSMDIALVKKKITKKTKLIILQHTFGIPPHRKEVIALARKHNVPVLEDLAHGFDERLFKKDRLETDKLVSFGRTKVISSMFGGAVVTTNPQLYKNLEQQLSELSYPSDHFILNCLLYKPFHVFMRDTYDYGIGKIAHYASNSMKIFPKEVSPKEDRLKLDSYVLKKYPNALALVLLKQMEKFQTMQDTKRALTNYYGDAQGIDFRDLPLNRFPILVKNSDDLYRSLTKKNIFLGRWYREVMPPKGECPVTEHVSAHILNLPTLVSMKSAERVVNEIDSSLLRI